MSIYRRFHLTPCIGDRGCHLRLCSCRIGVRPQPDNASKIELPNPAHLRPVKSHWLEDLCMLGKLIQGAKPFSGWEAKIRAQYSNNNIRFAIDLNRPTDHTGIASQSSPPKRVADHDKLVCIGLIVACLERPTELWLH